MHFIQPFQIRYDSLLLNKLNPTAELIFSTKDSYFCEVKEFKSEQKYLWSSSRPTYASCYRALSEEYPEFPNTFLMCSIFRIFLSPKLSFFTCARDNPLLTVEL
jgi:hypothetical protein